MAVCLFVFVAYSRAIRLSAILSVYGRRKPATPVVLSVAVHLRAPAGTDNQGLISHLRMSVDSASHYHRLGNVTLADISAWPIEKMSTKSHTNWSVKYSIFAGGETFRSLH